MLKFYATPEHTTQSVKDLGLEVSVEFNRHTNGDLYVELTIGKDFNNIILTAEQVKELVAYLTKEGWWL